MYSNKLKLVESDKTWLYQYKFYVVVRPNNGKTSFMKLMGLGRFISKVISREIIDCPIILKVENKMIKISEKKEL
jgi:hypothetical protein